MQIETRTRDHAKLLHRYRDRIGFTYTISRVFTYQLIAEYDKSKKHLWLSVALYKNYDTLSCALYKLFD